MAEELAFNNAFRQCCAVEFNEGVVGSVAFKMNGAGNQLLSNAAFSKYQGCGIGFGNLINHFKERNHRFCVTDNVCRTFFFRNGLFIVFIRIALLL